MTAQLERLIQDSKQLEAYIVTVRRKGKTDLASKLSRKQQFLNQTIAEFKQHAH